jgi:putative FmdB family regulatory protein
VPTYDYRCTECANEIEVRHGIDASGPATCDSCGGAMRKALSTPAIHFKGSGWAKKDARAASKAKAKPSKPAADSESAPSADGPSAAGETTSSPGSDDTKAKAKPKPKAEVKSSTSGSAPE